MSSDQQLPVPPPSPRDRGDTGQSYSLDAEISISETWAVIYARRYLIGRTALLTGVLATVGSYLMQPIFRAEVLVWPVTEQRTALSTVGAQFGGLAELAGVSLGSREDKAAALATLKSRLLTESFIHDRNLLPALFDNEWDSHNNRWDVADPEKIPTLWDAYRVFDKKVRAIEEDRRTGLVTLSIEWHDPKLAADWANELVRRTNAKLQQDTITEAEKTIAYLELQLAKAPVLEVRQAIYNLIEVETKNIAIAHAREEFAFKIIDPATAPRKRVKPDRVLMFIVGFMAGLTLSTAWVLLRNSDA